MKRLRELQTINKHRFHFKSLITRFTQGKTEVIESNSIEKCDKCGQLPDEKGHYCPLQSGKWIPNKKIKRIISPSAVVPLNQEEIRFEEGGTYDYEDRKLYCYEKLSKGNYVIYTHNNGDIATFKIHNKKNYSDYDDGLYIYYMKRGDRD